MDVTLEEVNKGTKRKNESFVIDSRVRFREEVTRDPRLVKVVNNERDCAPRVCN